MPAPRPRQGWPWPVPRARWRAVDTDGWRTFEVTSTVEVLKPAGMTRVWLPLPLMVETTYQKSLASTFHAEGGQAREEKDAATATPS